jgi:D-proline reductase (dithiol) PrdB
MTRRMLRTWVGLETPRPIPWTPLSKPLGECKVALLSTGGIALKTDRPFDQEGERRNPWWGDPSFRILPGATRTEDVRVYHLHIDPRPVEQDLNCIFPLERLKALESEGVIGCSAERHYSIMGYILDPEILLLETAPAIVRDLRAQQADAVLLAPV